MKNNANVKRLTYTVVELCPHCQNEIEMRWDTNTLGFKAFCPVCGERLMLCDECRHAGCGSCDFDSESDSCMHNRQNQSSEPNDKEGYIVLVYPSIAISMIVDLGYGPATDNGDRCSQYFNIAKGREHLERKVSAMLIENINGLPDGAGYYTIHLIDDVNNLPCESYHTNDLNTDSLVKLLEEILAKLENN